MFEPGQFGFSRDVREGGPVAGIEHTPEGLGGPFGVAFQQKMIPDFEPVCVAVG